MCLTCACGLPHDDLGDPGHLTIEDLEKSAAVDGIRLDEAVRNLIQAVEIAKGEAEHEHR